MTDVEKSKISFILCTIYGILLHFTLFWWKTFFRWQFTLFCRKSILRFTHFCVEKNLAKNSARGEKSRNGDTLGPVELIVWPEQGNQGDWREQDG